MSEGQDELSRFSQANLLADQGRIDEAVAALQALDGFGPAHANLALLLEQKRDLHGALAQHRLACALMPGHAQVWFNAGTALEHARHYTESEAAYRRALALHPHFAEAWHNLGNCLQEQGRVKEAAQAYNQALSLNPDFAPAKSSRLMNLHYLPDAGPEAIFEATTSCAPPCREKTATKRRQDGPLRIGLLCAYVRRHPLGALALAGLERLDRQRFSLHVYVNGPSGDESAKRLQAASKGWTEIDALSDQVVAEKIASDGIDILIDLAGHTRGHRLGVMALRPAPLQIHWGCAYWNGLGMPAIDYILTDRTEAPPDNLPPLTETPLYLPDSFACFNPPDDLPPVSPLPMLERGSPSFASFNRLAKLNDKLLALWGRLMDAAPKGSRLIVQAHAFDDEGVRERFLDRLNAVNIRASQVELIGAMTAQDVLKAYARADVALDSFPWSGSIITLEALMMGLPVVTWPHPSIAGRHSASFLTSLGKTEWIADSADDYIAKALDLVSNPNRLNTIRAGLRQQLLDSPVCDATMFAKNLEETLLQAWNG